VDFSQFTQRNYEYLKLLYEGGPYKVIVVKVPTNVESASFVSERRKAHE